MVFIGYLNSFIIRLVKEDIEIMKINKRYLKYLELLSQDKYMTSKSLSEQIGCSQKTVHNDLKIINQILESNGAQIVSKIGSGYLLKIDDNSLYQTFINQKNRTLTLESKSERIQILLQYLMVNNDHYTHLEFLADFIYVSRTTLINLLDDIKGILSDYQLEYCSSRDGIKIVGEEMNFRLCLVNSLIKKDDTFLDNHNDTIKKLGNIVNSIINEKYQISYFCFQNLLVHLFVALQHMKQNTYISPLSINEISKIKEYPEYIYADKIMKDISQEFSVDVTETEICYVTIHLAAKRLLEKNMLDSKDDIVISSEIHNLVTEILDNVYQTYQIDFRHNFDLYVALCLHFVTLNVRLKYHLFQQNPMLKNIKNECQLAYIIALSSDHVIFKHLKRHLNDDEIAYIALHFNLALEKKEIKKKNILLVCSTGLGSSEFLKYQFVNKFSDYIEKADVCNSSQIKYVDLKQYHYIFSTVPILQHLDVPVIYIHMFLNDEEIKTIQKTLNYSSIDICMFYSSQLFFPYISSENKEAVIKEMIDNISKVRKVDSCLYDEIMQREKLSVTEFGKGVAFPHPCHPCTDVTFVAIGILNKPIVWNEEKVQLIYMLVLGREPIDKSIIQNFYEKTADLLMNRKKIKTIINHRQYSIFIEQLLEE